MIHITEVGFISDTSYEEITGFLKELYKYGFDEAWKGDAWAVVGSRSGGKIWYYQLPYGTDGGLMEYIDAYGARDGHACMTGIGVEIRYRPKPDDVFWDAARYAHDNWIDGEKKSPKPVAKQTTTEKVMGWGCSAIIILLMVCLVVELGGMLLVLLGISAG